MPTAVCPVCKKDVRNAANLASHLRSKHSEYLQPEKKPGTTRAEKLRERAAEYSRQSSATLRDISPLPDVKDPARRARCAASLLQHCRVYHPAKFFLPFSPIHLRVIQKMERCIRQGGVLSVAMPRGSGKSELAKRACEWAVINGYRRFVVLLGATQELAEGLLADIQAQIESNDLLAEDYPEVCHPVRRLENIILRCRGQTFGGEPTRIEWTKSFIRVANIPGSVSAGSIIRAEGLTGALRGMSAPAPDGSTIRPDLVIPDDPQTRESACSPTQVRTRESIITGDVLGLAGPVRQIACIMPCTVIATNDLADRLLNRNLNPQWQGERSKLVEAFPTAEKRWEEYFKIRDEDYRADGDGSKAREFYKAHRAEMDAGCVLSWPERFDSQAFESAVEEAMCYRHYKARAFAAEAQNEPQDDAEIATGSLSPVLLAEKTNNQPRGLVPREATRLTAGIDVQGQILFWVVTAWDEQFGGAVVDYGAWPRQNRSHFLAADARPSLSDTYPGVDEGARVYAGLEALTNHILGRGWQREGGGESRIDRCLIDSGWRTDTIYQFVKQSRHTALLLPSKGYGITASAPPMASWPWKPGQRGGKHWRVSPQTASGRGRLCIFDSNYWKSFLVGRLATPKGGTGCLMLPGGDNGHLVDHLVSEYRVTVAHEKQGRRVDEWKLKPATTENHWLDALVLATVAATVEGLKWDSRVAAATAAVDSPAPVAPRPAKPKKRGGFDLLAATGQKSPSGGMPRWLKR